MTHMIWSGPGNNPYITVKCSIPYTVYGIVVHRPPNIKSMPSLREIPNKNIRICTTFSAFEQSLEKNFLKFQTC